MTGFRFMLPLLAVLVSLALQPAFAKEGAKFRAIIAGVTDYRGGLESNPPLNLDKAASLMRDAIREVALRNGFVRDEDIDIRLLVDRGKSDGKPTRANFVDQLQIVARASDKGDWLVVYFTGHGKEDRLLLSGSYPDLAGGHLDFSVVKKIIQASEASAKLIFLDTCRTLNAESSLGGDDTFSASNQLRKSVPEGEAWFFSTQHGYPSHVDRTTRYGYYTKFLLAGLQEYSANPTLTGQKLGNYLKRKVKNAVVAGNLGSPQKPFDQIASGFNLWGETKGVSTIYIPAVANSPPKCIGPMRHIYAQNSDIGGADHTQLYNVGALPVTLHNAHVSGPDNDWFSFAIPECADGTEISQAKVTLDGISVDTYLWIHEGGVMGGRPVTFSPPGGSLVTRGQGEIMVRVQAYAGASQYNLRFELETN